MSSAATIQALENIPGLFTPQREFCIHNSSDEPIALCYDGDDFVVPAFNEVQKPHPKYPEVFHSMQDAEGNFIPGTLVIRDKIENRNANADLLGKDSRGDRWDSAAAVRHCLGVDLKSKQPSSAWWNKGISLLPIGATPDVIKAAVKDGRERWAKFQLVSDRELVNSFAARTSKEKQLGLLPMPVPATVAEAQARLVQAASKGIQVPEDKPTQAAKEGLVDALLEDQDFLDLLKAKLSEKKAKK